MVKTLYVGNLPWSTNETELIAWAMPHARVKGARIILDRETGRSRGFGFLEVEAEDIEKAVTALNGAELGGREVMVNEAQARQR